MCTDLFGGPSLGYELLSFKFHKDLIFRCGDIYQNAALRFFAANVDSKRIDCGFFWGGRW